MLAGGWKLWVVVIIFWLVVGAGWLWMVVEIFWLVVAGGGW